MIPSTLRKINGTVIHTCNSSIGELELSRSLGFPTCLVHSSSSRYLIDPVWGQCLWNSTWIVLRPTHTHLIHIYIWTHKHLCTHLNINTKNRHEDSEVLISTCQHLICSSIMWKSQMDLVDWHWASRNNQCYPKLQMLSQAWFFGIQYQWSPRHVTYAFWFADHILVHSHKGANSEEVPFTW